MDGVSIECENRIYENVFSTNIVDIKVYFSRNKGIVKLP